MDEEMNSLVKIETWDLVPELKDVDSITYKCIYKIKQKVDGNVNKYKARFVVGGSLKNIEKIMRRLLVLLQR